MRSQVVIGAGVEAGVDERCELDRGSSDGGQRPQTSVT